MLMKKIGILFGQEHSFPPAFVEKVNQKTGGKDIVAASGSVIAQDEATSVVWGMPGAAVHAGICAAVLPLGQIAPKLVRLFSGDRS